MTVASEITRIEGNIAAAYTAASAKGATLPATENSDNLATCIASISGGGGSSVTSDVPLTRVTDDNNNEIGTWFMNFLDGNGNLYKVVLLDAQYRNDSTQWCSDTNRVTNMPMYSDLKTSNIWEAKETATQNTQMILNYCNANNYTSTACSHCRSKSFVIGGVTYYGQLPNLIETVYLARHYNEFDALDTSSSTYTSTNFNSGHNLSSSSQNGSSNSWCLRTGCFTYFVGKTATNFTTPVLEIPISTTNKTYYAWRQATGLFLYTSELSPTTNSILYGINNNNVMEIASRLQIENVASDGSNITTQFMGTDYTLDRYSPSDMSINYTPV